MGECGEDSRGRPEGVAGGSIWSAAVLFKRGKNVPKPIFSQHTS
jgi:hypothetical protein